MEQTSAAPASENSTIHPWRRFVAIGDSFTEGVGDPDPESPGGVRGWADRVAEQLAAPAPDFAYANLAVRGRLISQIVDEQVEPALALRPDLISLCAGGNDVIRPGSDPDDIAELFESAAERLTSEGATLIVFTGIDVRFSPVFRPFRGKVAIYNENIRTIADRYDAIVADQWALTSVQDAGAFADDRLHYNAVGHHEVARMVLRALNVPNTLAPMVPAERATVPWREARAGDLVWARSHLVPWVLRRIRHQSSGDTVTAKRPDAGPVAAPIQGTDSMIASEIELGVPKR